MYTQHYQDLYAHQCTHHVHTYTEKGRDRETRIKSKRERGREGNGESSELCDSTVLSFLFSVPAMIFINITIYLGSSLLL